MNKSTAAYPWGIGRALLVLAVACSGCTTTTTSNETLPGRESRSRNEAPNPEMLYKTRLELAALQFGNGQPEVALAEVNAALAAKPDQAEAIALRGLIHASLRDPAQAEGDFKRALQLDPTNGSTMQNYGWFLCQERRYAEADAQFAQALALPQYRDSVRTLMSQGVCQARAGQWLQAERTLSRSFELDPANPVTAMNLSAVLLHRGELERARFYVRRLNSVPEQVTAQSLWLAARIERRMGNFELLQQLGRQLRERFPKSQEALLFERGRFDD
jgi:type IV pilus assembly protein PilF